MTAKQDTVICKPHHTTPHLQDQIFRFVLVSMSRQYLVILHLLFLLILRSHTLGFCYDVKCILYNGSYIDCDTEHSRCIDGTSDIDLGSCVESVSEEDTPLWCSQMEVCKHVEYTGRLEGGSLYHVLLFTIY